MNIRITKVSNGFILYDEGNSKVLIFEQDYTLMSYLGELIYDKVVSAKPLPRTPSDEDDIPF